MATTSTLASVKAALVDELQALSIAAQSALSPSEVQVSYARPPVDQLKNEAVYLSSDASTISDEQRLTSGRRKRQYVWTFDLVVTSRVHADSELAEARAFAVFATIESWLADKPQPAEWVNTPTDAGALSLVPRAIRTDIVETDQGKHQCTIFVSLELRENLQ